MKKAMYEAPVAEVIEIMAENVILTGSEFSGDTPGPYQEEGPYGR
jgi:hypothetical protein